MNLCNLTELDSLIIDEVFEYYDQPLIYTCKSPNGDLFLAMLTGGKGHYISKFTYIPISENRLKEARERKINLKDCILQSENGYVFEVTCYGSLKPEERKTEVVKINCHELDGDKVLYVDGFLDEPLDFKGAN